MATPTLQAKHSIPQQVSSFDWKKLNSAGSRLLVLDLCYDSEIFERFQEAIIEAHDEKKVFGILIVGSSLICDERNTKISIQEKLDLNLKANNALSSKYFAGFLYSEDLLADPELNKEKDHSQNLKRMEKLDKMTKQFHKTESKSQITIKDVIDFSIIIQIVRRKSSKVELISFSQEKSALIRALTVMVQDGFEIFADAPIDFNLKAHWMTLLLKKLVVFFKDVLDWLKRIVKKIVMIVDKVRKLINTIKELGDDLE